MRDENVKTGAREMEVFVVVCDDVFVAQDAVEILSEVEEISRVVQARSLAEAAAIVQETEGRVAVVVVLNREPLNESPLADLLARRDGVMIVLSEEFPEDIAPTCRVIHGQAPFTSQSLADLVRRF